MIDFEKLRLPPSYTSDRFAVKKILTTIPLRKPRRTEFFRIRDDPAWTFDALILDLNEGDEEKYLVSPELQGELLQMGLLKPVRIYTGITYSTNVIFLSEVGMPGVDGKQNDYNRSRMEHYETAKKKWAKIGANKDLGAYEIYLPETNLPEPAWPEEPENMRKALEITFKGKVVDSDTHPILNRLLGRL